MNRPGCYLLLLLVIGFGWQNDLRGQATGVPAGIVQKPPSISTQKEEDSISVRRQADTLIYEVRSPSGIGGAALPEASPQPEKVVLRLYLKGLESLTIDNGEVRWQASIASHGENWQRVSVKRADRRAEAKTGTPFWTTIAAFGADGQPLEGLPQKGGYFEVQLPQALLEKPSSGFRVQWIDFYR